MEFFQAFGNLRPEFRFPMLSGYPKHLNPFRNNRWPAIAILGFEGEHLTP
jgi:hypothetical protein